MHRHHTSPWPWLVLTLGSTAGTAASFIQIIERIQFAERPLQMVPCDLNSVFSCSNVFNAWQSSVFGFSNSIMCLLFFGVMLGVSLSGLYGSQLRKGLRITMHSFSLFFLGFGAWYLQQSTFVIGALCIFCVLCYAGVIAINWAWLRINAADLPIGPRHKNALQNGFKSGADTFFWLIWAFVFVAFITLRFW